jgi:D-alanyl-lipoteichoic acid acyltransferase DltB (MBOAT superfamily)
VLLGWWLLRRPTQRLAFLAAMSYVFYAYWDWRFLGLMWLSTGIDYAAGRTIVRTPDRKRARLYLIAAMSANLALLGYFKYAGFFLDSLQGIGSALGMDTNLPAIHVILPIGISFYTFNSMSYTIDVYRGVCRPAKNIVHYAAFVAMFPHLIAGPIVRYADIESQLARLAPKLTPVLAASGIFFFACGLAKKLLFADTLAPTVDQLFARHDSLGLISAWGAALGYSLQLYFDFSGYSDMAVGLAFLLGFRFPQNFNSPFKSVNISDFWRRWHMSLSFFLRDYLFIPLGGSRGSHAETLRNLVVVMFLGGLWHGAAWTFAVWGLLHGVFLVVHAVARGAGLTPPSVLVNRAITFVAVVAAFVVFRAASLGDALDVLAGMAGLHGIGVVSFGSAYALAVVALVVFVNVAPNTWEITVRPTPRVAAALGFAASIAVLQIAEPSPFLYFQF